MQRLWQNIGIWQRGVVEECRKDSSQKMAESLKVKVTSITAVGRSIDPNFPTNRAIAALVAIVVFGGTVFRLFGGVSLVQSAAWGIAAGLGIFLAWALGRELDPDHDPSAFVGAGLALVGLVFFGLPNLGVLFWVLVLVRIVNRTVGLPAKLTDSLLFVGLGGWLTWQGNWVFGLMTALAFFLDSRLSRPHKRHLVFAAIALIGTAILLIVHGNILGGGRPSLPAILAVFGISVLFVPVVFASRELRTVSDETNEPLDAKRVQAAQVVAILTGIQIALWGDAPGVIALLPLWATVLGLSLYRLFSVVYSSVLLKAEDTKA